ncbi:MAG: glycosyltransferase family 4 protein [Anaerolineae bacterium]
MLSGLRIAWVIPTLSHSGGVGPACWYAAEGAARLVDGQVTVVSLHEAPEARIDPTAGVQFVALGLVEDAAREFLRWLEANPQDLVITNDVSRIETSFPYFPPTVAHVIQIHDSSHRYQDVAVRHSRYINGVLCVAHHIETQLREKLVEVGFQGVCGTVHNGAYFVPAPIRSKAEGALRLLFTGNLDPLIKGVFDLVPILQRVVRAGVPVRLTVAGGYSDALEARFKKAKLDHLVTWIGRVPHETCYHLATESDVFLMTSRRESFGMVTIEAMSMGCVPLAYDIPSGNREIIEHNKSGFLLPLGDFNAWATTIKALHDDREWLLTLSQGAMIRARETFDNKRQAARLVEFLEEVRTNAGRYPPERKRGYPQASIGSSGQSMYHKLPPHFRAWVRDTVGRYPRLSYWLINR